AAQHQAAQHQAAQHQADAASGRHNVNAVYSHPYFHGSVTERRLLGPPPPLQGPGGTTIFGRAPERAPFPGRFPGGAAVPTSDPRNAAALGGPLGYHCPGKSLGHRCLGAPLPLGGPLGVPLPLTRSLENHRPWRFPVGATAPGKAPGRPTAPGPSSWQDPVGATPWEGPGVLLPMCGAPETPPPWNVLWGTTALGGSLGRLFL
ncbi:basic salivary proline-rich protein 1-like, partial [Homarus americanus]|uniref:basic salivary proline-rich protein 1-like n=1 Tax=Homarus americanus TaxID=6706 RepID=UPI001C44A5B4